MFFLNFEFRLLFKRISISAWGVLEFPHNELVRKRAVRMKQMSATGIKSFSLRTILFCLAAFAFSVCIGRASFAVNGLEDLEKDDYKVVAKARLDMVYMDGKIYMQSLGGEERLSMHDTYRLVFMDHLGVKIQFARLEGKMLVAQVIPEEAASALPEGMIVEIAIENLAKPAEFHMDKPQVLDITNNFMKIRGRPATKAPFGLVAQVSLISSDNDIMFYFGQYTGLLAGDDVEIASALGKGILARVRRATDQYVDFSVTRGSAHIFNEGEMVIIRDVAQGLDLRFMPYPDQLKIPPVPRFITPSAPKVIPINK